MTIKQTCSLGVYLLSVIPGVVFIFSTEVSHQNIHSLTAWKLKGVYVSDGFNFPCMVTWIVVK